eukprot:tig00021275_g19866.t1
MLFEPDVADQAAEVVELRAKLEHALKTIRKFKDDTQAFQMERELLHETVDLLKKELEKEVRKNAELEIAMRKLQESVAHRQRPGGAPVDPASREYPTSPRLHAPGLGGTPPSPSRSGLPGKLPASPHPADSDSDHETLQKRDLRAELESSNRERIILRERVIQLQEADNAMRRDLFDSNRRISDLADRLEATKLELDRSRLQLRKVGDLVHGQSPAPPPPALAQPPPPIPSQSSPIKSPQVARRESGGFGFAPGASSRGVYPTGAAAAAQSAAGAVAAGAGHGQRFHASHEDFQPAAFSQSSRELREAPPAALAHSSSRDLSASLRGGSFDEGTGTYNGRPVRVRQSVAALAQAAARDAAMGPLPPPPTRSRQPRPPGRRRRALGPSSCCPGPAGPAGPAGPTPPPGPAPARPPRPSAPPPPRGPAPRRRALLLLLLRPRPHPAHAPAPSSVVERTPPGPPPLQRSESPAISVSSRATTEGGEEPPALPPAPQTRFLYNAQPGAEAGQAGGLRSRRGRRGRPARRPRPSTPAPCGGAPALNGFAINASPSREAYPSRPYDPSPSLSRGAPDRERHVPPYQPTGRLAYPQGRAPYHEEPPTLRRDLSATFSGGYSERDLRAAEREREQAISARGLPAQYGYPPVQPLAPPPPQPAGQQPQPWAGAALRASFQSMSGISGALYDPRGPGPAPPPPPHHDIYGTYRAGKPPTPSSAAALAASGPASYRGGYAAERELASTPGGGALGRVLAPTPIHAGGAGSRAPSVARADGRSSAAFDPGNYFKPITGPEDAEERAPEAYPPVPPLAGPALSAPSSSSSLPPSGFSSARGYPPARPIVQPAAPAATRETPTAQRPVSLTPVQQMLLQQQQQQQQAQAQAQRPLSRPQAVLQAPPPAALPASPLRQCARCGATFHPSDHSALCEKSAYHPGPTESVPHKGGGFAELYVCCNRVFHIVGGGDDKWIRVAGCKSQGHV